MKKVGNYFKCITPFIYAFLIQVVISTIVSVVYSFILGFQSASQGVTDPNKLAEIITNSMGSEYMLYVSAMVAIGNLIIFGVWYKKSMKEQETAPLKEVLQVKNLGYIILLGIGLQVGVSMLLNLVTMMKPEWFETYGEVIEQLGMGSSIISFVYIGIIAPISEEIIFRGVILERCKKVMPYAIANVFQAVLFGVYHMNLVQGLYAFALGMCMGLVCIKIKSIYGAILLHMAINIGGILLNMVFSETTEVSVVIMILLVIISGAGMFAGIRYFIQMKNQEVEAEGFHM